MQPTQFYVHYLTHERKGTSHYCIAGPYSEATILIAFQTINRSLSISNARVSEKPHQEEPTQ